ncbi:hypothetical protein ACFQ21_17085 [Ohtaekwangia kribbensis]|jgi:hypothetical protein|uniref:Uncharacterized protein n=1 Tax=Ohtaekwangia kribbensis TaxID=688913 RepID=A0ABW3K459_9BACT
MNTSEISTGTTIKKLTQKMDALLSRYNSARESFTSIRSVIELLNPAPTLMYQPCKSHSVYQNTIYTRLR